MPPRQGPPRQSEDQPGQPTSHTTGSTPPRGRGCLRFCQPWRHRGGRITSVDRYVEKAHALREQGFYVFPSARTAAARAGFHRRFENEMEPDGLLDPAERARRAQEPVTRTCLRAFHGQRQGGPPAGGPPWVQC
jgi:hypothetical protein